jgi:hypothetical protein
MEINKKDLTKCVKALNECGLAAFKVDTKQNMESVMSDFMSAVETVPVEKENELPDVIADMYNLLADNKTMEGGFDIADAALAARNKKEEIEMGKAKQVEKKETKKEKPKPAEKPAKVTKPVKEMVTKEKPVKDKESKPKVEKVVKDPNKINVRPGSKFDMAIDFVRTHPGATCYDLKQCAWNEKNDPFRNLFAKLISKGQARKEGKGYYINEGF